MDLLLELLSKALEGDGIATYVPGMQLNIYEIIDNECYKALKKIRDIVRDDSLEDPECFMKIEKIVSALEDAGSNGGNRHDFG